MRVEEVTRGKRVQTEMGRAPMTVLFPPTSREGKEGGPVTEVKVIGWKPREWKRLYLGGGG